MPLVRVKAHTRNGKRVGGYAQRRDLRGGRKGGVATGRTDRKGRQIFAGGPPRRKPVRGGTSGRSSVKVYALKTKTEPLHRDKGASRPRKSKKGPRVGPLTRGERVEHGTYGRKGRVLGVDEWHNPVVAWDDRPGFPEKRAKHEVRRVRRRRYNP